jgi:K+-transporting ATPase ATPase C chain
MSSTSTTNRQLSAAVRMLLSLTLLLGVLYPALVWGIGRVALGGEAGGSRVERDGVVVGSSLLGQQFTEDRFFQGRPSASEYAGGVSGGSNLSPTDPDQHAAVAERKAAYGELNEGASSASSASLG